MLQVLALFCTYLILSITFASALELRIYTSDNQEFSAVFPDFQDFIQKILSYPYIGNYQYIKIQLQSADPAYILKKVYLFRCREMSPAECIENGIQPVVSVGSGLLFDETYRWDDVSSNNVGNFLIFAKLDVGGKEIWTGSWDRVTKTGIKMFYHETHTMDRVDLYLKPGVSGESVAAYIEKYYAVPSDDVNRSVFRTISGYPAEKLYDLSGSNEKIDPSGTGIPEFYANTLESDTFPGNTRTWDFVFGGNGKTAGPVVFYSGEAGPPVTGGANLVVDDLSPQIVTCGSDEVLHAVMHVENASDAGYFQDYYYEIDGVRGDDITCSITNPSEDIYSYECSVPVSGFPVCVPGTSSITFHFTYGGGIRLSADFPLTLQAPEPKLILKSLRPNPFDCGIDTELTAELRVLNPAEGTPETYYTFDGTNFNPLECSGSGETYVCEIPESDICSLLQEDLELTFKFVYGDFETLSLPSHLFVTFPPPSMGIDTVTPQTVEAGETTNVNVLLHVNYPDFITYDENDFFYQYLDKGFQQAGCSLETSYSNMKYYRCVLALEIPFDEDGVKTLSFRLDGFMDGEPKQLTANTFFEILPPPPEPSLRIISASSPVDCVTDDFVTFDIKVENVDPEKIGNIKYTTDSMTYSEIPFTRSGNVFSCSLPAKEACDEMKSVVSYVFSLEDPKTGKTYYSNPQKVYFKIPEPHIQVYSVQPDHLVTGQNSVTIGLYVQYPSMVGDNPVFLYSYLDRMNQQMSCSKVSSTNIRDFYTCSNVEFDVPEGYEKASLPVLFSVQGTTLSFPINIPVTVVTTEEPWLEIVSVNPSKIEITPGNQTSAEFYVTVHNAAENELKNQVTLIPNSWITSGSCEETGIKYDFRCKVTIKAPKTASPGSNTLTLSLRASNGKTYEISDTSNVYVLPEKARLEIQSVSPQTLYCEGHRQQNPSSVKVSARVDKVDKFELVEEDMSFNDRAISHTARYCTSKGTSVTCDIPTYKLLERVECGQGELAPGEGSHYYPLSLSLLLSSKGEMISVSDSADISVEARPLEPYIEIADNDISEGVLQTPINCLGAQTLKLGDTGYVRIMYADLLHPEPKDDLKWSFRLDAHDDKGKLTKGMGISPTANATICKLVDYQRVGVHRIEDYECSLYFDMNMFQRCADGTGEILLTATSGGTTAEGRIKTDIVRDDRLYRIDMEILTAPEKEIDCQIQSYGKKAPCSLASHSNQNVTIRVYNLNKDVELTDLKLYDFDINFKEKESAEIVNLRTLGSCRKDSKESNRYVCPFQIGPVIRLPFNVTKERDTYNPIKLGVINVTIYVKYANDLARATISKLDGSITIHPKKSDSMINREKMMERMEETFKNFEEIFKSVVAVMTFCAVCSAGNMAVDSIKSSIGEVADTIRGEKSGDKTTGGIVTGAQTMVYDITGTWYDTSLIWSHSDITDITKTITKKKETGEKLTTEDYIRIITSVVVGLLVVVGLFAWLLPKLGLTGKKSPEEAQKETQSEITKYMEKGIKWGFGVCVIPRIVGDVGAWIAKEGSKTEDVFKGVSAFGKGLGTACNTVMELIPFLLMFLEFYTSYLQFEMCMDMMKARAESIAQSASRATGPYGVVAGTGAGITMMNDMMNCFNMLMVAMQRLTMASMFMAQYMGTSGGRTSVIYTVNGETVHGGETICGNKVLYIEAKNFCRSGTPQKKIQVFGEHCKSQTATDECLYTMPMYPSNYAYGTYGAWMPYSYKTGDVITLSYDLDSKCDSDSEITVVVDGIKRVTTKFKYEKKCAGGEEESEKKAEGKECENDNECRDGLKCCYRAQDAQYKVCSEAAQCVEKQDSSQSSSEQKKQEGEQCGDDEDCESDYFCCYTSENEVNKVKRCTLNLINCVCKIDTKTGFCEETNPDEDHYTCEKTSECPTNVSLCCVEKG